MRSSREKSGNAGHRTGNCANRDAAVGMCANCGHRISVCGRTFTADIECNKCKYINEFRCSQQPVSVRQMNSNVENVVH